MVSFAALRDAKPALWKTAAEDWVSLALEAEQAANNIYDQGTSALNEHWIDEVGEHAAQKLKELAQACRDGRRRSRLSRWRRWAPCWRCSPLG